jgi:hypothetical protein
MDIKLLRDLAKWELIANFVLWAVNAIFIATLGLVYGSFQYFTSSAFISMILLLECGLNFVVGGVIAFSGSVSASKTQDLIQKSDKPWFVEKLKTSEKRANKYLILAVIIFLESLIVSFFGY